MNRSPTLEGGAKPFRVQLSRKAGWRMPENTMSVARPTAWGNPYDVRRYGLDLCLQAFRNTATGYWNPRVVPEGSHRDSWIDWIYEDHCAWMERVRKTYNCSAFDAVRFLRGKNLACWCPLDQRCHADILLELANRG